MKKFTVTIVIFLQLLILPPADGFCLRPISGRNSHLSLFTNHRHTAVGDRTIAVWTVTDACPYHCLHCINIPGGKAIGTEEGKRLLDRIKILTPNVKTIIFSGGEPMLRRDLPELIDYANGIGFKVRINTSGILLTEPFLSQVKGCSAKVILSLHADDALVEDKMHGRKGHLQAFEEALKLLSDNGISTTVVTVATKLNYEYIPGVIDILSKYTIDKWRIQQFIPRGIGGSKHHEELLLSKEEFSGLESRIRGSLPPKFEVEFIELDSPSYEGSFIISQTGEIYLPEYSLLTELFIGNIFEIVDRTDLASHEEDAIRRYLRLPRSNQHSVYSIIDSCA